MPRSDLQRQPGRAIAFAAEHASADNASGERFRRKPIVRKRPVGLPPITVFSSDLITEIPHPG
jgi:hypothetical protein